MIFDKPTRSAVEKAGGGMGGGAGLSSPPLPQARIDRINKKVIDNLAE
jgi:hypothetical protein